MAAIALSERFRAVLLAHREEWNARFERRGRNLEPRAFLDFLARTAGPLVDAAGDASAEAAARALFDLGLTGLERGLVGREEASGFERALVANLPRLGRHWNAAPAPILAALGNAWHGLARELGEPAARSWLEELAAVAGDCATRDALLDAGLVLAWRGGLAEARDTAIARAAALDPALRKSILGAAEIDPSLERRFARPGSTAPLATVSLVARVGAFLGFGGLFRVPPRVCAVDRHLLATDGDTTAEVHADVFGARLRPATWPAEALARASTGDEPPQVGAEGGIRWSGHESRFAELRGEVASVAAVPGMAAVTLADSHAVFVLGLVESARA